MRLVEWKQGDQKRWSYIRDGDSDDVAPHGIPASVPDLASLDWPSIVQEMTAALESQHLFSYLDIERSGIGVTPALTIIKRYLLGLYRSGT